MNCPFCEIEESRVILESDIGLVIRDAFPISPGHTLVIPKKHIPSFFKLERADRDGLLDLLEKAKLNLDREYNPQSYNVGINDGPEAGQTIPHLHIHIIPRYRGDCEDPRGGVRWINPDKAKYWSSG